MSAAPQAQKPPILIQFRANDVLLRAIDRASARDFCSPDVCRKLVAERLRQRKLLEERPEQLALRLGWLRQSGGELGIETAELALQIFERLARDAALSLRRAILLQRPVAPGEG